MHKTKLSNRGAVTIPKFVRDAHHWKAGQELIVIDTNEGVLLRPVRPAPSSTLEELAGCLKPAGLVKTLRDMDRAIQEGIRQTRDEAGD